MQTFESSMKLELSLVLAGFSKMAFVFVPPLQRNASSCDPHCQLGISVMDFDITKRLSRNGGECSGKKWYCCGRLRP